MASSHKGGVYEPYKTRTQVVCLTLLGLCFGWSNVSRAEAPPPQDSLWSQQWNMKNTGQTGSPQLAVGWQDSRFEAFPQQRGLLKNPCG